MNKVYSVGERKSFYAEASKAMKNCGTNYGRSFKSSLERPRVHSLKKFTEHINLSRWTIEYHIAKLKREDSIERIEPTKRGYWKVIEK